MSSCFGVDTDVSSSDEHVHLVCVPTPAATTEAEDTEPMLLSAPRAGRTEAELDMPKEVSTPKQSGGGGYTFADKVSASFLLKMLTGSPPLDAEAGQIESMRFEKRVDGWFLDDLVLSLRKVNGETAAVALSIKSNAQITQEGVSADFTRAVWEQRLHVQTDKFDPDNDYLAIAGSPIDINVKSAWDGLLRKAIDADPTVFADRITTPKYSNEIERAIFNCLDCPSEVDSAWTTIDTARLLRRLRHFQFDFESTPSSNENDCVMRCAESLRDGGQVEALSLWTHLKQIARSLATSGGDLTRAQLAGRLRATFSLKESPDYVSDWRKLSDDFNIRIERIRGTLAGTLEILRDDIPTSHREQRITALVGSSGSGKTVLAKNIASVAANDGHVLWLTPEDLNLNDISEQFAALGIRHPLPELVAQSISRHALMVVDGFERLDQRGLANLAVVLRRARIQEGSSAWSFIFTCAVDMWDSNYQALKREYGGRLSVGVTTVEFSFYAHRRLVVEAFPTMARMLQRPNLPSVFRNLKILDLVLSNANEETNTATWVGETDILDWYWSQHIQTGSDRVARSRFAQKLACVEADQFLTGVPIGEFDSDECRLSVGLEQDQVVRSHEERFRFEHDLLSDWARARFLISRQHEVVDLVRDKALNPRWHRAIRIYGLCLLENQANGDERWSELISQLSPKGQHKVEGDLVLEAIAFAANAEPLLQQVWNRLVENDGALLTRLLTRFLHVATLPDPRYAGLPDDVAMAACHRIPFWPLWLPILRVLHENRATSIPLAISEVTHIAELWLRAMGREWPLRDEAAQILLDATSFVVDEIRQKDWHVDGDLCGLVFSRFLTAATVRPDEVAELALSLAERREQSLFAKDESDESADENYEEEELAGVSALSGPRGPVAEPWPDGPRRSVNHEVHDGFLSGSDPLQYLFAVRPDAANEVLLALLIREPLPTTVNSFHGPFDEFLYVSTAHSWSPGMFFHGPFLSFLQTNWEKGVEGIVGLVNFITQRWMDNRNEPPPPVSATIDGECVEYCGSSDAYYWYRESVHAPDVVVPALMALERWLYMRLERGEPIKPTVRQVLRASRSTALLGVLAAVGRKQPELFNDELRELVPVWQLQVWEEEYRIQGQESLVGMTIMQWVRWGEATFNMVRDWHALDHRKTTLGDVLFEQFVTNSEFLAFMKNVQAEWCTELDELGASGDSEPLEKICLRFDERRWKGRPVEGGIALDFIEPEERTQRLAAVREENERHMAVLAFPRACRNLIDERKEMTQEELEAFWQHLRNIVNDAERARNRGDAPEHAIMGGIAVLSILHEPWLDAEPERKMWCMEEFVKILEAPPPHPQFRVAESLSNYHWDNFAAMLIPRILADAPTHEEIRSLCAEFALTLNHTVIQDVMRFAFEYREKIGDDFRRLQYLVLTSSGMRNVKAVTHGGNSIWACPDVEYDVGSRFGEVIEQFATSETPIELPSLVDVAEASTGTIVQMVRQQHEISYGEPVPEDAQESIAKRIRRGRGFEPYHLRAGFCWIESIEAAKDPGERMQWIDTLESLIHGFLRPLGGVEEALFDNDDYSTFFASPGRWDTWIFDLTASMLPKLEENESGHRLWQPILSLGLDRVHWVDAFISSWFIHGLKVEGFEANFFREWKAMIAYAWTQINWRHTEVTNHRSDDELFCHLMGFSTFGDGYFEDEKFRPYVASMKSEYDKWIDVFFPHPEATSAFANFLTFPSAVDYLRDGVQRIAEVSAEFQDWHWREFYHLDDALLKLLEHDWRENSRLISKDAEIRRQFSTILKTMTDRQIPRAMELQDRMTRAN